MRPGDQRELVERYIAAYNAFDVEGMVATMHPAIEFLNVSGGVTTTRVQGVAAFRALAEQSGALFSSRRQTITAFESGEGRAEAEVAWEGVLAADLPGFGEYGDEVRLLGRSEFEFRDGLIHRLTDRS